HPAAPALLHGADHADGSQGGDGSPRDVPEVPASHARHIRGSADLRCAQAGRRAGFGRRGLRGPEDDPLALSLGGQGHEPELRAGCRAPLPGRRSCVMATAALGALQSTTTAATTAQQASKTAVDYDAFLNLLVAQ